MILLTYIAIDKRQQSKILQGGGGQKLVGQASPWKIQLGGKWTVAPPPLHVPGKALEVWSSNEEKNVSDLRVSFCGVQDT